jgi:hypothetical protein
LSVVPDSANPGPTAAPDWAPLLRRAQIADAEAIPVQPTKRPPAYCDQVTAWRVERTDDRGGPFVVHAGAAGGRPTWFALVPAVPPPDPPSRNPAFVAIDLIALLILIASIFLAWRNAKLGRVDRRSAFLCALVMLTLYALIEAFSVRIHEGGGLLQLLDLLRDRAGGHILLHALSVWVGYLAIEPYVRRIWPRMLVGIVRLFSGRLRDPLVGREVLIGMTAGIGVVALGWLIEFLCRRAGLGHAFPPPTLNVYPLANPGAFVISTLYAIAVPVLSTINMVTALLVFRLLSGRNWAATALGAALFAFYISGDASGSPVAPLAIAAGSLVYGVVMVLVFTRVGLLAAYAMQAALIFFGSAPVTTDLTVWYAPYAIASYVALLGVAGWAFWLALGGQPLMTDILAPEKGERRVAGQNA